MGGRGQTALILATEGHENDTRLLTAIRNKNNAGSTALMNVTECVREMIVSRLLDAGASVDEKANYGDTALIHAALTGREMILQRLLDAKAKVDERNGNGYTALMAAAHYGHEKVVI